MRPVWEPSRLTATKKTQGNLPVGSRSPPSCAFTPPAIRIIEIKMWGEQHMVATESNCVPLHFIKAKRWIPSKWYVTPCWTRQDFFVSPRPQLRNYCPTVESCQPSPLTFTTVRRSLISFRIMQLYQWVYGYREGCPDNFRLLKDFVVYFKSRVLSPKNSLKN